MPNKAKVLAVGPGIYNHSANEYVPVNVEVGETILFTKYAGTEIELDDKKYLIIKEPDIVATFKSK